MTTLRRNMKVIERGNTRRHRVAAIGMYDGVHLGHRFLIDFLRHEASDRDLTPAVVTFREHPLKIVRPDETPALLTSLEDRLRLLAEEGVKDVILLTFDENMRYSTARQFLMMLHKRFAVDALVVGFNNRFGRNIEDGIEQYRSVGREIGLEIIEAPEYIDRTGTHISSSIIRRLLEDRKVAEAYRLLGRRFTLRGTVVKGNGLGRKIGYPTANISPEFPELMTPGEGVYVAQAVLPDGQRYPAVVNIGRRPTVSQEDTGGDETTEEFVENTGQSPAPVVIEVHVINYKGYLYDDEISIEFVDFLREEQKFPSVEKLRDQLEKDVREALKRLKLR